MKKLIIAFSIFIISCTKNKVLNQENENILYYKLSQINYDGKEYVTPIHIVHWYNNFSPPVSEDTCLNCPLPLMIEEYKTLYIGNNKVEITWISNNEQDIIRYDIHRSKNSKDWSLIKSILKSSGKYFYLDKIH